MGSCSAIFSSPLPVYSEGLADFHQALTKCCSHAHSDKFWECKKVALAGEREQCCNGGSLLTWTLPSEAFVKGLRNASGLSCRSQSAKPRRNKVFLVQNFFLIRVSAASTIRVSTTFGVQMHSHRQHGHCWHKLHGFWSRKHQQPLCELPQQTRLK